MLKTVAIAIVTATILHVSAGDNWSSTLAIANEVARVPSPPAPKVKEAEKTFRELFKNHLGKTRFEDRREFIRTLLTLGQEPPTEDALRFVMLKESYALAAQLADAEVALTAIELLSRAFVIDDISALKLEALTKCSMTVNTSDAIKSLVRLFARAIDEAVKLNSYDTALKMLSAAEAIARRANELSFINRFQLQTRHVRVLKTEYAKVLAIRKSGFKDVPEDPEENLAYGKFLCFVKDDWVNGLHYLEYGDDPVLKQMAAKELDGVEPSDEVAAGDRWWEYAETASGFARKGAQNRAAFWYSAALKKVTSPIRLRLEKRLQSLPVERQSLVVWNMHGTNRNFGTREFDVTLIADKSEVWTETGVNIDWSADKDVSKTIHLPNLKFNRIRIKITKAVNQGGGLSEIELIRGGVNVALGCKTTVTSVYDDNKKYGPQTLTDGITTDATPEVGYWFSRNQTDTIEITLP